MNEKIKCISFLDESYRVDFETFYLSRNFHFEDVYTYIVHRTYDDSTAARK